MKKNLTIPLFSWDKGKRKMFFMRLGLLKLMLIFGLMSTHAEVDSQTIISELKLEDVDLSDALERIEELSSYDFVFNYNDLKGYKVSVDINETSLENCLDEVLKDVPFEYKTNDDVVIIFYQEKVEQTQEQKKNIIKGKVTDKGGIGLPGVSVVFKGSNIGVATDIDGNYILSTARESFILTFSFVGMVSKDITYTGKSTINVVLLDNAANIEEVIVTGIFTRKAESFTGSAVSVKGEDLEKLSSGNLLDALKSIDPSLAFTDNVDFGSDPNKMPDLKLRGTSTFPGEKNVNFRGDYGSNPNMPLFILDGFEVSQSTIFDFDRERIESVTILKDASSKAIYGSKGANGVIVIETKRPLSGEIRTIVRSSVDITMPDLSSYNLCNALEKIEVERIAGVYDGSSVSDELTKKRLYNYRYKKALEGDDTYWLSKPLRTGVGTKQSLMIALGEQKTKIIASLSYQNVQGVMKGSFRENISASVSVDYRHKAFIFRNMMSVNSNSTEDSPYGNFSDYAKMNSYWSAYNEDGTIATGNLIDGYTNPLQNANVNTSLKSSYFEFVYNFYSEWTIMEGLKATARLGVTKKRSDADRFYPGNHTRFNDYTDDDSFRKGSYELNQGKFSNLSGDLNIRYFKSIKDHNFSANLGFNTGEKIESEVINYAEGFPSDRMNDITFALGYLKNGSPRGQERTIRDIGALGVFTYDYNNKYLCDLTIRNNGSSQFGSNNRWGTFWSSGFGWNMHKENFMKGNDLFKRLKIRGSVGTSGNQNFSSYQSISTYKYYNSRNYGKELGTYIIGMANKDLKWEEKLEYNIGVDANIGRLSMVFEFYNARTKNLITNLSVPTSVGFSTVKENIGEVENKGCELRLNYQLIKHNEGFLNVNLSISTNSNKLLHLSGAMRKYNEDQDARAASGDDNVPVSRYVEGKSMNTIWAVPSLGIDPATGRELYIKKDGTPTHTWSSSDQISAGNSDPKYRGIFGLNGEYKGFGFNLTTRFTVDRDMYNNTLVSKVENINPKYNVDKRVLEGRWRTPGQISSYKILAPYWDGTKNVTPKTEPTTRFIQNVNELDISSISVYYELNKSFVKKIGMEKLKFMFNMNDVYKFSNIELERGIYYPFARTMSFSIKATL